MEAFPNRYHHSFVKYYKEGKSVTYYQIQNILNTEINSNAFFFHRVDVLHGKLVLKAFLPFFFFIQLT